MNPTPLFVVFLYIVLLPVVFKVLQYTRLDEMFKRKTPPNFMVLMYVLLTIAITQLVVGYFVAVFGWLGEVF
ncbi:MAG: hypothetical protein FWE07_06475 [Turicibacter sp.]|nr:hypothetical protein [Turicibacter sp.]